MIDIHSKSFIDNSEKPTEIRLEKFFHNENNRNVKSVIITLVMQIDHSHSYFSADLGCTQYE